MPEITELIQSPYPGEEVDLFDLDLRPLGGPVLYFSNYTLEDHEKIVWRGHTYEPAALQVNGYEYNSEGRPVRPKMIVGQGTIDSEAYQGSLSALGAMYGYFVGCWVTRWKTYRMYLDDAETADPAAHLPTEKYLISQMTGENALYVEWELGMSIDQEGMLIPRGTMTQKHCQWTYRVWDPVEEEFVYDKVVCPYDGTDYYDENGDVTLNPAEDKCSKRLDTGCRLRFGTNSVLPFGGFPAMRQLTGPN